tara:strand:- start:210 stop:2177 length:1968 start_codon:yes stop_codon:yes gene_type:complete
MGQINIEGLGIVEIDGNEPTEEELQNIDELFATQGTTSEQTTPEEQDSNAFAEFFKENLDIPGGLGGAYTGFKTVAKYTKIPLALVAGGIVGGAIGTFFGSANSSEYKTGEADYNKALKDASVSVGFDVATLGLFKSIAPIYYAVKTKRKNFSPPEISKNVGASGTIESLRRTQAFLSEGGGTLLPSQTGRASKTREIGETIGAVGLLSRRRIDDIAKTNKNIIVKEIEKQIDGINPNLIRNSSEELGDEMINIIKEGKKLNQISYDVGLTRIANDYGNINVPIDNIVNTMDNFVIEASKDGINTLSKESLKVIEKTKNNLIGSQLSLSKAKNQFLPYSSVNKLIAFQKEINKDVSAAGNFNSPTYNSSVERELTRFSKKLQDSIDSSLNIANKDLAKDYRSINKAYGETLGNLLPKINKGIVTQADNGNYHRMGNLLLANNDVSKISAMMKSIDTSFELAKKQKLSMNTSVQSAEEAKQMIRQSYIKNFFGETSGDFDPQKYFSKFTQIDKKPNEIAKLKAILGKDGYNNFKKLANAAEESTKQPGQDMFSLAVRSRETSSALQISGSIVTGGTVGIIPAFAIFAVPEVIGRIAVNKRAVNKLLALNSQVKRSEAGIGKVLTASNVAKATASIIDELPDYDKEAIKFYMGAKEE